MILSMGRLFYPDAPNILLKSFQQLLELKLPPQENYILIDVSSYSLLNEKMRLRSCIFSENPLFFIPNY